MPASIKPNCDEIPPALYLCLFAAGLQQQQKGNQYFKPWKNAAFTQNYIKAKGIKNDSIENAGLQQKIFQLHKVSRKDFYTSYNYYAARPVEMRKILDSISAKGERDRGKMMEERYGGIKKEPQ